MAPDFCLQNHAKTLHIVLQKKQPKYIPSSRRHESILPDSTEPFIEHNVANNDSLMIIITLQKNPNWKCRFVDLTSNWSCSSVGRVSDSNRGILGCKHPTVAGSNPVSFTFLNSRQYNGVFFFQYSTQQNQLFLQQHLNSIKDRTINMIVCDVSTIYLWKIFLHINISL